MKIRSESNNSSKSAVKIRTTTHDRANWNDQSTETVSSSSSGSPAVVIIRCVCIMDFNTYTQSALLRIQQLRATTRKAYTSVEFNSPRQLPALTPDTYRPNSAEFCQLSRIILSNPQCNPHYFENNSLKSGFYVLFRK